MRKTSLQILTTILVLCFVGCASPGGGTGDDDDPPGSPDAGVTPPPPPPPPMGSGVTGRWTGSFTSDSSLASAGDFTFDLTEDMTSHAVTGPFTGTVTAGASGTAFKGTFTGSRTNMTLTGTVAVSEPAGITGNFDFQDAAIGSDTIAGNFIINVSYSGLPIMATGGYSIKRVQ